MGRYVDVDTVRDWLDLDADVDRGRDTELEQLIAGVENEIDAHCGGQQRYRIFTAPAASSTKIYRAGLVAHDGEYWTEIHDSAGPTLVETSSDRTTWSTITGWWAEPDNQPVRTHVATTTSPQKWLRVTAAWGTPGGVPPEVATVLKIRSAQLWARRDSPDGVAGSNDFGMVFVSRYTDPDIVRILAPIERSGAHSLGMA